MQSKIAPFLSVVLMETISSYFNLQRKWRSCLQLEKSWGKMVDGGAMVQPKYLTLHTQVHVTLFVYNMEWGHTDWQNKVTG